jgi:hypothetical protein
MNVSGGHALVAVRILFMAFARYTHSHSLLVCVCVGGGGGFTQSLFLKDNFKMVLAFFTIIWLITEASHVAFQTKAKGKGAEEYWLIWRFEGEDTLYDLMQSKEFPYNVSSASTLKKS